MEILNISELIHCNDPNFKLITPDHKISYSKSILTQYITQTQLFHTKQTLATHYTH